MSAYRTTIVDGVQTNNKHKRYILNKMYDDFIYSLTITFISYDLESLDP